MTHLSLHPNIVDPDDIYDRLIALHAELDDRQSMIVNSKLVLLLANHIGDGRILHEAIGLARDGMRDPSVDSSPAPLPG